MSIGSHGDVARELVRNARSQAGLKETEVLSAATNTLIDAVEQDLIERANQAVIDEERLTAVETQSRLTAEAVTAIKANTHTEAADEDSVARANQALVTEDRLRAIETQSRITAEAVIAITGAVQNAAPAILELQDQLDEYRAPEE